MAVMLQTLIDLANEFGRRVGEIDASNSRWLEATRYRWINEGQLDVVERTRCLEEEWTSSVSEWVSAGDEIVTFPANLFEDGITEIYWVDSSDIEHKLSERHPRHDTTQNDSATGTPSMYFTVGRNLHLMPLPDADGTAKIRGQSMPNELTEATSQTLIPPSYRRLVAIWAVMTALTEDGEYAEADRIRMYEYEPGIERLKAYANGRRSKRGSKFHFPEYL